MVLKQRLLGKKPYKHCFYIATEGTKTEPQYFEMLNNKNDEIRIKIIKTKHSSPLHVLESMQRELKKQRLKPKDEAWLVVDKDDWADNQLNTLRKWSESKENYGLALSNPKFEYWLLLHFEHSADLNRLARHLPGYDKKIDSKKFSIESIKNAVTRAKKDRGPPCTTVHKLVEKLISSQLTA